MSTTIDNRVVEMRFDNQNFERNVGTSLTTLEKLKQSLHLTGATKGLENVNAAAKNCNLSPLGAAAETVHAKFSAMEVMAVTALANITNSAVNAGKRIVSALTIDPVMTGFSEYETKINAVQTIMSNTASKGTTMADVTKTLNELNTYADKTIYNFAEMTRNIGTFTAAGVGLEESASAIQGIANLAAASGSTSQQASTAMYQLSQALAAGTVKLMDWNSVVNAGMGGEKFQEALKATAREHGVAVDSIIEKNGSFRESLSDGWISAEILNDTLRKFTVEGAKEYSEAMVKSGKYTQAQADALMAEAQSMEDAATKVKTFTQLWDTMKESVQSGWAQTWELLIGDFEEAKSLLTGLSDFFGGIIAKISDARNYVIESALGKSITVFSEKLNSLTAPVKETVAAVKDLGDIVNKVLIGDFGNGADRIKALTEAGYDYAAVQNKVNEKLGVAYRHTEKLTGAQEGNADGAKDQTAATIELNDEEKERIKSLLKMTEAELRSKGYTDEQIESLRELGEQAKNLGVPIDEFVDNLDKLNGRFLLLNGFKNIGRALVKVFQALGDAWNNVFNPPTLDEQADGLFNIITNFSKFTSKLVPTEEAAEKLTKTFEGLFAIVDMIVTVTGGGLKFAFEILKAVLEVLGVDILDVTAAVGEAIVNFKEWLESTVDLSGIINFIAPAIANAIKGVHNWIKENVNLVEGFKMVVSAVKGAVDGFRSWIDSLKNSKNLPKDIADGIVSAFGKVVDFFGNTFSTLWDGLTNGFSNVPGDMISGFVNGLWNGIQVAGQVVVELGKIILEKIKEVLGIHSPSTEFFEIGANVIQGFVNGIKDTAAIAWEALKRFAEECINVVSRIDMGQVLAGALGIGLTTGFVKIGNALESFASPFEGIGDIFQSTSKAMDAFRGVLKSYSTSIKAGALKDIAIAIAILVGSIVVLTLLDIGKTWAAIGVLVALGAGLVIVMKSLSSVTTAGESIKFGTIAAIMVGIGVAMLLMAKAAKTIGEMDESAVGRGLGAITQFGLLIAGLMVVARLPGTEIDKIGSLLLKISISMLLLVWVMKLVGNLDDREMGRGILAISAFGLVMGGLILMTSLSGRRVSKLGSTLLKMSMAILLLVGVAKIISMLDPEAMAKGIIGITAFTVVIGLLLAVTRAASGTMAKNLGSTLIAVSIAIGILALVATMLGSVSVGNLTKGIIAIGALSAIVIALMIVIELFNGKEVKLASTLLAMSISIGVLAGISLLLGLVEIPMLAKGIVAVGLLASLMALMIAATKNASSCLGNLVTMTVAIAAMAAAVIALSFIDSTSLATATGALAMLMGMFAVLIKVSGSAKGSMGTLIVLAVVVTLLGGVLYLLGTLPMHGTIEAAASLSLLVIALSASMVLLGKFSGSVAKALTGVLALTAMAVPLLAFVGVLALMSGVQNAITNAIILGAFATVLSGLLVVLTIVGTLASNALLGVLALTAMAVPLLAFVGILTLMEGLQNATQNVLLLSGLLLVVTGCLAVLALVGPLALTGLGALAGLTLLVAAIGAFAIGVGELFTQFPQLEELLNKGLPILEQVFLSIGTMIGNLVAGAFTALADSLPHIGECLTQFMDNAHGFIAGAKEVDDKVLAGVSILALAILELTVVDLINGITSLLQFGDNFASLGTELSLFMNNASDFIEGAKSMSSTSMDGVKALAEVILILTGAQILDGLTSWFTGGASLTAFAEDLEPFGKAMNRYSAELTKGDGINTKAVDASANAANALANLANNLPKTGGFLQTICGESTSIDMFGNQLYSFAINMTRYSQALSEGDFNAEIVTASANAATALAELANNLPKKGGFLQAFLGENTGMDAFGLQLVSFGTSMVRYSQILSEGGGINEEAITASARAGTALSELANGLPTRGGFLQAFLGETTTMDEFGRQIYSFGISMVNFSNAVTSNGGIKQSAVDSAVKAGQALTGLANNLPKENGWLENIFGGGQMSLEDFGNDLKKFGEAMSGFSTSVATVDTSKLSSVITQVKRIGEFAQLTDDATTTGMINFANALKLMGEQGISTFIEGLDGSGAKVSAAGGRLIDSLIAGVALKVMDLTLALGQVISKATEALSNDGAMSSAGQTIVTNFVSGINTKGAEAKTASENIVKNVLATIRNKYTEFDTVGQTSMHQFVTGMKDRKSLVEKGAIEVVDNCRQKLRNEYENFKSAGKYVVDGFAAGISANTFAAEAKAEAMAEAALDAAREALNEHSPSKEAYKIGDYFGLGFVNALDDYRGTAFNTAYEMADNAKRGLSGAIAKIKDVIDSDIDSQPTIRPVLDLSGVQSGVGTLNGMFGITPSMGVLANVGSIGSMMNTNQNGGNDDVVSAIKDLGDRIGEMSGDSYNLGDVTYDDGSNVHNAVKSLVRATRIERRR